MSWRELTICHHRGRRINASIIRNGIFAETLVQTVYKAASGHAAIMAVSISPSQSKALTESVSLSTAYMYTQP